MARSRWCIALLVVVCAPIMLAQREEYDAILVPVYYSGPGAYGSNWRSVMSIYNGADTPADFATHVYTNPCVISGCSGPIPPHATVPLGYGENHRAGLILYPPKTHRDHLQYQLRVRDFSRAPLTWGTEIPVIRELEFREGPIDLLDVPTSTEFRATLRVYSLEEIPSNATIRVYSQPEADHFLVQPAPPPTLLGELDVILEPNTRCLPLPTPHFPCLTPMFPIEPAFARVDSLAAVFPDIQDHDRVRVAIQSGTVDVRIWGFVTVTSNETQNVTTITPQ